MTRPDFKSISLQIGKHAKAVPSQLNQKLQRVITRGDRTTKDGYFFLFSENAGFILLIILHRTIKEKQRPCKLEDVRHVVNERYFRSCTANSSCENCVA